VIYFPIMLNRRSLQIIQSENDKAVYVTVTNCALYLATCGYLEHANQLLTALWNYKLPHDRDTWLPDTAFMVLWDAAGSRPEIIPFFPDDIDSIERNMRGYIATDRWGYKMPEGPWQGLKGQDLWRKAILTARMVKAAPVTRMDLNSILTEEAADMSNYLVKIGEYLKSFDVEASDSFPSTEDELEALAMLKKMVAEGYNPSDGLALGAELAARNGQRDTAIQFAKLWAQEAVQNPLSCNFPVLACSRHVAPLLLERIVGPELGLSDDYVKEFLTEVLTALDKRMAGGRTLVYGSLSWKELIQDISREAIRIEGENVYDGDVCNSGWIGFEGVDTLEIALAMEKLNIQLPEDYKHFLKVTNGMPAFPLSNPSLLPVGQIDYLINVIEPYFFDIILNVHTDEKEILRHAVLISKYPDEQLVWLIPVDKERTKWQSWFYASWMPGATIFPSFRFYMEDALAGMEAYR
jgi:hypothetical protein